MSNITPFEFEQLPVRVITIDGEPWFVGKEIAEVLGYKDATNAMKQHCKGVVKHHPLQTKGGMQELRIINEPDMLRLIVGSQLPAAARFEAWVFEDVLPTIRKTGSYTVKRRRSAPTRLQQSTEAARAFQPFMKVALLLGCDRNAAAISANQAIMKLTSVNLLEDLGQTHLEAEHAGHWYNPTEIGRETGHSARAVNILMAELGLQRCIEGRWEPTEFGKEMSRTFDTGKKHGSGVPVTQVKWSSNVIPMIAESRKSA